MSPLFPPEKGCCFCSQLFYQKALGLVNIILTRKGRNYELLTMIEAGKSSSKNIAHSKPNPSDCCGVKKTV
jgi:hypothetical protein